MKTVFQVLNEFNKSEIARLSDFLCDGKCDDFAEYKHVCGQIRGLMIADAEVNDLSRNMEKADED